MKKKHKTTTGALSPSAGFPGSDMVNKTPYTAIQLVGSKNSEFYLVFCLADGTQKSFPYNKIKSWVNDGLLPHDMDENTKEYIKAIIADFDDKIAAATQN